MSEMVALSSFQGVVHYPLLLKLAINKEEMADWILPGYKVAGRPPG
jgi:hypothetical protein